MPAPVKRVAVLPLSLDTRARLFRLLDTVRSLEAPQRGGSVQLGAGMLATMQEDARELLATLPRFSELRPPAPPKFRAGVFKRERGTKK